MKKRLSLSQKNTKNKDKIILKKLFSFKINTCQKEIKINKQFLKNFQMFLQLNSQIEIFHK